MAPLLSSEGNSSEAEDELPALQAHTKSRPNPDVMIWSSTDEIDPSQVNHPPPHLAKRFYHSGTNRRRSSAASSRRNSITSSQSHHSNRSFRSSLHRNSVAQHLRRASILEDRKARLQDRAAHAEQVRLRAALAKAAPRISHSEEKALAAQQAREKYLAKVTAACAEEVNRSKRIAEENKERKAAEERRCRHELEEKHADAEKRRQEYRRQFRRPRTTSQAHADEIKQTELRKKVLTQGEACVRIQRVWRKSQRRRVVSAFQKLDISTYRIGRSTFEEATELLNVDAVITTTGSLLRIFGIEAGSLEDTTPVRTFLSAFMILGHATIVFTRNSEQEQDLINKAKDVLISFETMISAFAGSPSATASPTHVETLQQSHATYSTAFVAWKARDASTLIETMVDQFVALDAIWQRVKDDTTGEVASDYRTGIRDQQVMIYSKIKKLAGHDRADSLIKRAINQNRRQMSRRRRPIGEVRPRQMEQTQTEFEDVSMSSNEAPTVVPPSDDQEGQEPQRDQSISRLFSVFPSNRVLVHELMIDPNYKIEPSPTSDVRNAFNREVCDSMRKGVEDGQSEVWTVAVAENIRTRLLKLLRSGNSMHQLLTEVLDTDHVRNECRHGQFSYDKFFEFMANLLPRLCAPVRDAEVQALAQTLKSPTENTDAMIEKLFGLLHVIDMLSLDHANYLIRERSTLLIREGTGYEQRAFQTDVDENRTTLNRTTRWWRNASLNLVTETSVHDPRPAQQRPAFAQIYARGLTDLAVALGPLSEDDLPETLSFDVGRLSRMRSDVLRFVVVGGVLSTAKNLLKRDVRSQWKPEARRAFEALQNGYSDPTGDLSARMLAIVESGHGMPSSSKDHLANIITRFLGQAGSGQLRDPVLKLLLQRLKGHLFNRLAAQSSVERVRVASTTSEGLANIGLGEFIAQIGACADELGKVMQVDVQSHGVWLRRIAEEADVLGTREVPRTS